MNVLIRIVISFTIVWFLSFGIGLGQNIARQFLYNGVDYATQGKFEEAKEEFEKTLKADPCYVSAIRYLKVIEDVNEGKIQFDTAMFFFEGLSHALKDQFAEAIAQFNKVIAAEPKYAIPYISRGKAFGLKGQHDQAIFDFNKAIEINPRDAIAYNNRGLAYAQKGQFDRAISDYNKALEINPKYAEAYNNRGIAYDEKGQHDKAISDYNKALEINPKYAVPYDNRGIAFCRKGQFDQAISDYNKALEINPKYAEAYINRGNVYSYKEQHDMAISDYSKAIEINPKHAGAYYSRGYIYSKKGQYDLAVSDYSKAIEISPKYDLAYCSRGNSYSEKGQYDLAISDYNKAIEIIGTYAHTDSKRSRSHHYKREYEMSLNEVRTAQSLGYQVDPALLKSLQEATKEITTESKSVSLDDAGVRRLLFEEVSGTFVDSPKEGKLFVIKGMVVKMYSSNRRFVLVKGAILNNQGKVVQEKFAYAGNRFEDEQLKQMSLEEINHALKDRSGQRNVNENIEAGGTIPFMVVFSGLPENLSEFIVETVSSSPVSGMKEEKE